MQSGGPLVCANCSRLAVRGVALRYLTVTASRVSQRRGYSVSTVSPSIIVHQPFRHADYKNQSRALLICADWNPGAAAPDTDNYFINQIGARMRKRDAVFDYAWVFPFAGEDLFEKSFGIIDLSTLREHLNNLAQRIRQFSRAQPQNYLSFIEKISERDSHWAERDLLDYPAKPVIQ